MSKSLASEDAKKAELEAEIKSLMDFQEQSLRAYDILYESLQAVCACEDILYRKGTVATMILIVNQAKLAMEAADSLKPWADAKAEGEGCIYCSVCERFFGIESEKAGRCLSCEHMDCDPQ